MSIFPTLWYVGAHQTPFSRYLHASLSLSSRLYVLGGYDETQTLQPTLFIAAPAPPGSAPPGGGWRWEAGPPMPHAVARPARWPREGRGCMCWGVGCEGGARALGAVL